ncbi:MAG: nucleotidyltransferase family protein [Chloroflexi bacterium]|nr:nucleotidyltransferase family protein [Chloroflexota bacterium]
MARALDASIVPVGGTIRDAMRALDAGARQIALAVDGGGRLVGVATDGNIRRAILGGASPDDPLEPALTRTFVAVGPNDGRAEVLDLMRARSIGSIPVVDDAGRPIGLHRLNEFLDPAPRPNAAVVMAGGQGTRLRPITAAVPKPMIRVAGRPILERIVLHLASHGISRVYLAINYLGPVIEEHFEDGARFGCRIDYLREDQPLGTAGALGLLPEPPQHALLVMNGDLVTQADLGGLLDTHAAGGYSATIGVRKYLHSVPFGTVERDGPNVTALEEKPTLVREANTGMYALSPALVARVERDERLDMPDLVSAALARGERVGAFEIEDDWIDVGQREQLERARQGE